MKFEKQGVCFVAIKENIQTKVMTTQSLKRVL